MAATKAPRLAPTKGSFADAVARFSNPADELRQLLDNAERAIGACVSHAEHLRSITKEGSADRIYAGYAFGLADTAHDQIIRATALADRLYEGGVQ